MFRIVSEPIQGPLLSPESSSGAVVVFEGRVRDLNEGKRVQRLEYEAFEPLASQEGTRIIEETASKYQIEQVACEHRVGLLELGDIAIRLEVASGHRKEAFAACSAIVDEIKRSLPIWKKEHYADGDSGWLNCQVAPAQLEQEYYARQIRLPEVGAQGQEKLKKAKVLVVGAGGLGCPALLYLAAAGVGTIGICEPEDLELSNLHRQTLYACEDVGKAKLELASNRIGKLNPNISVFQEPGELTKANVAAMVGRYDMVLDCTDNFRTKFLLNDACVAQSKTLVYASIYQYEGQLFVVEPGGPCLRCLWPQEPPANCVGNCAEVGVLGFVPGVIGTLQAAEALKRILHISETGGTMVLMDIPDLSISKVAIPKNPQCPGCGTGAIEAGPWWEIHADKLSDLAPFTLIDIREAIELAKEPFPISVDAWKPMSSSHPEEILEVAPGDLLLICRSGARTAQMALAFAEAGVDRVYSLAGGLRTLLTLKGKIES